MSDLQVLHEMTSFESKLLRVLMMRASLLVVAVAAEAVDLRPSSRTTRNNRRSRVWLPSRRGRAVQRLRSPSGKRRNGVTMRARWEAGERDEAWAEPGDWTEGEWMSGRRSRQPQSQRPGANAPASSPRLWLRLGSQRLLRGKAGPSPWEGSVLGSCFHS